MLANRVREFTLTTGAGDIMLAGPLPGHIAFADGFAVGDSITYVIEDGDDYEIGTGTLTAADTLQRTAVGETLVGGVYDKTSPSPISLSGNARVYCAATADFLLDPTLEVDTIREQTPDGGVTVDDVLLKDGGGTFVNPVIAQGAVAPFDAHVVQDTMVGTIPVHWQKQATSYILQAGGVGNLATFDLANLGMSLVGNATVGGDVTVGVDRSVYVRGGLNAFRGVVPETDMNLMLGTGSGSEPRIYLYGSANAQPTAGDVFIGTKDNTGTLRIEGSIDASGNMNINSGNSIHSADYGNLLIGDFAGGNNGITIQTPNTGRGGIAFSDGNTAGVASRQGRFDFTHALDRFEWLTSDGLRMSLSASLLDVQAGAQFSGNVTVGGELSLEDTLRTLSTGDTWFDFRDTVGTANYGAFRKPDGTALGYIGGGGGAALSGSSTVDDFVLRSEGKLVLASGGNIARMEIASNGDALLSGALGLGADATTHKLEVKGTSSNILKLWRQVGSGWVEFFEGATRKAYFGYESGGGGGIVGDAEPDAIVLRSTEGPIHLCGNVTSVALGLTVASDGITLGRSTNINGDSTFSGASANIATFSRASGAGWLEFHEGATRKAYFGFEAGVGGSIATNAANDAVVLRGTAGPVHILGGGNGNADHGLTVDSSLITLGRDTQVSGALTLPNNIDFRFEDTTSVARTSLRLDDGNNLNIGVSVGDTIFRGAGYADVGRITASGDLGIGATSPYGPLHIERAATGVTQYIKANSDAATGNYAEIAFQLWAGADGTGTGFGNALQTGRPSVVIRAESEDNTARGAFVVGTFEGGANNSALTEKFRVASDGTTSIAGNATVNGQVYMAGGLPTAPSLAFAVEPNTGLYRRGAGQIGFSVLDGDAAWLDATQLQLASGVSLVVNDDAQFAGAVDILSSGKIRFANGRSINWFDNAAVERNGIVWDALNSLHLYSGTDNAPFLTGSADKTATFAGQIVGSQANTAFGAVASSVGNGPFTFMDVSGGLNRIGAYDYAVAEWQDLHLNNSALILGSNANNRAATFASDVTASNFWANFKGDASNPVFQIDADGGGGATGLFGRGDIGAEFLAATVAGSEALRVGTSDATMSVDIIGDGATLTPFKMQWQRNDGGIGSKRWIQYIEADHRMVLGRADDIGALTNEWFSIAADGETSIAGDLNARTGFFRDSAGGRIVLDDSDVADASGPMMFITSDTGNMHFGTANRNASGGTTGSQTLMTLNTAGNLQVVNDLVLGSNSDAPSTIRFSTNRSGAVQTLGEIDAFWNNTRVALIEFLAGTDSVNKDDGQIVFFTAPDSASGVQERLRIGSNLANFRVPVEADEFLADAGSAVTPTHSFSGDSDTGMYHVGTDAIGFSTGGSQGIGLTTTDLNVYRDLNLQGNDMSNVGILTVNNEVRLPDGGPGDPSMTFSTDSNTSGFYRAGANVIGVSAANTPVLLIDSLGLRSALTGTAANPVYTFDGDRDTGMYRWDADNLGFSAGGTHVMRIDPFNVTLSGGLNLQGNDLASVGMLNLGSPTELTVSSGEITVTRSYHKVDTEADAATDDLVTINGGSAGDRIVLSSASSARTITLKDIASGGNLQIAGEFSLSNPADTVELIFDGFNWLEICRSNNG